MSPETELILADAHVHIHDCFNLTDVFDSAQQNFLTVADRISDGRFTAGVLFLTEISSANCFEKMAKYTESQASSSWCFKKTEEPVSLIAQKNGHTPIVVIAG